MVLRYTDPDYFGQEEYRLIGSITKGRFIPELPKDFSETNFDYKVDSEGQTIVFNKETQEEYFLQDGDIMDIFDK